MTARELTELYLVAGEEGADNADRMRYYIALRNAKTWTALSHFVRLIGWVLRRKVAMMSRT